jgi:ABC-type lipoprotein export system ATPase subunit
MAGPRLEARGVGRLRRRAGQGERPILDGVDVVVQGGEVLVLAGPTGVGKSTLLHVLGGLLRPDAGEVLAEDAPVSRWTAAHRDRWRRRVGFLFQQAALLDDVSAFDNVLLPLVPRPGSLKNKTTAALAMLDRLDAAPLAAQPTGALSGGERQRVALARALVTAPDYLLLDEPTAHQDDVQVRRILDLMDEARGRGAVVVAATHDPRVVASGFADRVLTLTAASAHNEESAP